MIKIIQLFLGIRSDGIDNDCDNIVDDLILENLSEQIANVGAIQLYIDADGDGYGSLNQTIASCSVVDGYVNNPGDCDDSLGNGLNVYPDAPEICDGIDNDCDAMIDILDDNFSGSVLTLYVDSDGDGFGDENKETIVLAPFKMAIQKLQETVKMRLPRR